MGAPAIAFTSQTCLPHNDGRAFRIWQKCQIHLKRSLSMFQRYRAFVNLFSSLSLRNSPQALLRSGYRRLGLNWKRCRDASDCWYTSTDLASNELYINSVCPITTLCRFLLFCTRRTHQSPLRTTCLFSPQKITSS